MWTCPNCGRIFKKANQPHSCKSIPLEEHFKGKPLARSLFDNLLERINGEIGECQVISIPCCVHLCGKYDFLAALPKRDCLEVRFALDREMVHPRIHHCVPMSTKVFKICLDLFTEQDIDGELMGWLQESYSLKEL
jgi:hypothetical protein